MAHFVFESKKRGRKGEGRKVEFEHILVPKGLADDLRLFKDIYSVMSSGKMDKFGTPIPGHVSWEQMFRHWMGLVRAGEPEVWGQYRSRLESGKASLDVFPVDVTEGPLWEMRHFFYRDGDEIAAVPEDGSFYAVFEGVRKSLDEMCSDGWVLMNEAGVEIPADQIPSLSGILSEHL